MIINNMARMYYITEPLDKVERFWEDNFPKREDMTPETTAFLLGAYWSATHEVKRRASEVHDEYEKKEFTKQE